jgi:hypothetical protein
MTQISLRMLIYSFKDAFRMEKPLAGQAVVVEVRLGIVLLQTIFIGEELFTT